LRIGTDGRIKKAGLNYEQAGFLFKERDLT